MALSGYLVSRYGSKLVLTVAALLYPAALVGLGRLRRLDSSRWDSSCSASRPTCATSPSTRRESASNGSTTAVSWRRSTACGRWPDSAERAGQHADGWLRHSAADAFLHHLCGSSAVLVTMRGSMLPRDAKPVDEKKRKKGFRPSRPLHPAARTDRFRQHGLRGNHVRLERRLFRNGHPTSERADPARLHAFMCTMACGRFTADRLVTRFGAIRVIRASGIVIATGLLLSVLFPHLTTATLGFLLVGFGTSSVVPLCYSLAGRSKTMLPGVALATVSTIRIFSSFCSAQPVIGFIARVESALVVRADRLIGLTTRPSPPRCCDRNSSGLPLRRNRRPKSPFREVSHTIFFAIFERNVSKRYRYEKKSTDALFCSRRDS